MYDILRSALVKKKKYLSFQRIILCKSKIQTFILKRLVISGLYVNMSVVFGTNPFPHPSNTSGSKAPLLQHPPQHLGGHSSVLSCNQSHWVLEGDGGMMWNACLWFFGSFIAWRGWALLDKSFHTFTLFTFFHHFQGIKKHMTFSLRVESFQRTILVGQSFVWGAQRHGWIHQHTIFHPSEPSRKHIHSCW